MASSALEISRNGQFVAELQTNPTALGQVTIKDETTSNFSSLDQPSFIGLFDFANRLAQALATALEVKRVALASDGSVIHLIPLHGLDSQWEPVLYEEKEYHTKYPGFLTTKGAPKLPNGELDTVRERIAAVSGIKTPYNTHFDGDTADSNLFARLVRGELEQWRVYDGENHVSHLTPFPNTLGFTVLIPRKHLSSDIFSLGGAEYRGLMVVAHELIGIMRKAFGVERIGIFFEGYEIDYAHVKLIPVHLSPGDEEVQALPQAEFQAKYPGYVTTQPGPPADMEKLKELAIKIRDVLRK